MLVRNRGCCRGGIQRIRRENAEDLPDHQSRWLRKPEAVVRMAEELGLVNARADSIS